MKRSVHSGMAVCLAVATVLAMKLLTPAVSADDPKPEAIAVQALQAEADSEQPAFSRDTVDFGIVVSDIKAAQKFYAEVVGLQQVGQFDVSKEIAGDAGLTDAQPLSVIVMGISKEPTATRVKLMQLPQAPGQRPDNRFIHSTYGISYLTFFVTDMDAALKRAKQAGSQPIAKGPVDLKGDGSGAFLAVLRDPDGNMVELVGPKPKK